MPDLTYWSVCG